MMATLLFHECPLIVMITAGRLPPPSASTTSGGTSRPLMGSGGSTYDRNFIICSCHLVSARRAAVLRHPAQSGAASHATTSGPVKGPASLPSVSRCDPVPPGKTPTSLAGARRWQGANLTGLGALANPAHRQPRLRHRAARGQRSTACSLLGVGLVLSFSAVADVPYVAVRVGERTAVPAPLQLRRGHEDLPAGLLGLVQNFVDAVLAAHDVIEDDAAEAAALRARAHHVGEPVAAVEADQRTAVGNEEHRDLVVVLDLPAQPFRIEPLGPVHVLDAEEDRAHVRLHALSPLGLAGSPLGLAGDAHDRHARCGRVTRASRFLT